MPHQRVVIILGSHSPVVVHVIFYHSFGNYMYFVRIMRGSKVLAAGGGAVDTLDLLGIVVFTVFTILVDMCFSLEP